MKSETPNPRCGILPLSIVAIAVLLTASCSGGKWKPADLQGTWVPDKSSQTWIKAEKDRSKCQIVLQADGTFNATVPNYMLDTFDKCAGAVRVGTGRRSLTTEWPETRLNLRFSELDGEDCDNSTRPLRVETRNSLTFYDLRSGDRFIFERVPAQSEKK
jgi:hypothetical protein